MVYRCPQQADCRFHVVIALTSFHVDPSLANPWMQREAEEDQRTYQARNSILQHWHQFNIHPRTTINYFLPESRHVNKTFSSGPRLYWIITNASVISAARRDVVNIWLGLWIGLCTIETLSINQMTECYDSISTNTSENVLEMQNRFHQWSINHWCKSHESSKTEFCPRGAPAPRLCPQGQHHCFLLDQLSHQTVLNTSSNQLMVYCVVWSLQNIESTVPHCHFGAKGFWHSKTCIYDYQQVGRLSSQSPHCLKNMTCITGVIFILLHQRAAYFLFWPICSVFLQILPQLK